MKKTEPALTDFQQQCKDAWTPQMPEGLSLGQRLFFELAVKKIKFTPTDEGGLSIDYSGLTNEDLFAIGETETNAWPIGAPQSVQEKLKAIRPHKAMGIFPGDAKAKKRLIEQERRTISGSLSVAQEEKHAGSILGHYRSKTGAEARKEIGAKSADNVLTAATSLRKKNPRISRLAAANELAKSIGLGPRQIQRILDKHITKSDWPPLR